MLAFEVRTTKHTEFVDITGQVQSLVKKSAIQNGITACFVPHTTAAITINENADPDVVHDMIGALDAIAPWEKAEYRHSEGNSAAHVKTALLGTSVQVFVNQGKLWLGRWQGIFLCEFDGPRTRTVWVEIVASSEQVA
jgi:secondary thiamine-phosphate synthase enzyme